MSCNKNIHPPACPCSRFKTQSTNFQFPIDSIQQNHPVTRGSRFEPHAPRRRPRPCCFDLPAKLLLPCAHPTFGSILKWENLNRFVDIYLSIGKSQTRFGCLGVDANHDGTHDDASIEIHTHTQVKVGIIGLRDAVVLLVAIVVTFPRFLSLQGWMIGWMASEETCAQAAFNPLPHIFVSSPIPRSESSCVHSCQQNTAIFFIHACFSKQNLVVVVVVNNGNAALELAFCNENECQVCVTKSGFVQDDDASGVTLP